MASTVCRLLLNLSCHNFSINLQLRFQSIPHYLKFIRNLLFDSILIKIVTWVDNLIACVLCRAICVYPSSEAVLKRYLISVRQSLFFFFRANIHVFPCIPVSVFHFYFTLNAHCRNTVALCVEIGVMISIFLIKYLKSVTILLFISNLQLISLILLPSAGYCGKCCPLKMSWVCPKISFQSVIPGTWTGEGAEASILLSWNGKATAFQP